MKKIKKHRSKGTKKTLRGKTRAQPVEEDSSPVKKARGPAKRRFPCPDCQHDRDAHTKETYHNPAGRGCIMCNCARTKEAIT